MMQFSSSSHDKFEPIRNNDVESLVKAMKKGVFEHCAVLAWQEAMIYHGWTYANPYPTRHALNLFIIHEFKSEYMPHAVHAYLLTSAGRKSMLETIEKCMEIDADYAAKIQALLGDFDSTLYKGLRVHRNPTSSKEPPTTFTAIRKLCIEVHMQKAVFEEKQRKNQEAREQRIAEAEARKAAEKKKTSLW